MWRLRSQTSQIIPEENLRQIKWKKQMSQTPKQQTKTIDQLFTYSRKPNTSVSRGTSTSGAQAPTSLVLAPSGRQELISTSSLGGSRLPRTNIATSNIEELRRQLDSLTERAMLIAIDTEFEGPATLTIQAATRLPTGEIAVQIYSSPTIPAPPNDLGLPATIGSDNKIVVCPHRDIVIDDLSPVQLLLDLRQLEGAESHFLTAGQVLLHDQSSTPPNATWDEKTRRWKTPTIQIRLVGHFLPADLTRIFSSLFYESILSSPDGTASPTSLADQGILRVRGRSEFDLTPIVEFLRLNDGSLYAIRLEMFDTNRAFGPMKLDAAARAFAGVTKVDDVINKSAMREEFSRRPVATYRYAATDAIITLLVYEGMCMADRRLWEQFNLPYPASNQMKSTLGRRVVDFLSAAQQQYASGSAILADQPIFKRLQRAGGSAQLARQSHIEFARQAAVVHGGLLLNRSSHQLWHSAPEQLHDVDIKGCYATLMGRMSFYLGRPILWTPGNTQVPLRTAADLMRAHCPDDGAHRYPPPSAIRRRR